MCIYNFIYSFRMSLSYEKKIQIRSILTVVAAILSQWTCTIALVFTMKHLLSDSPISVFFYCQNFKNYLQYLFCFVAEKSSVLYNMVTFNVAIAMVTIISVFCNRCQCLITSVIYISVYSLSRRFLSDQNEAPHDPDSALKKIVRGLSQAIQRGI